VSGLRHLADETRAAQRFELAGAPPGYIVVGEFRVSRRELP